MLIKKVANLSEEEISSLTDAGKIIGDLNKAFEVNEITDISEDNVKLLVALAEIINKVLCKNNH
jgi:hypothetical protein